MQGKLGLGMELKLLIDKHPENIERLCKNLRNKPDIIKSDSTRLAEIAMVKSV